MAPEQARSEKALSVAADVWGLGAILYELLTGRPPFQAATPLDTVLQVLERDPQRPRALDPRIDRDLETLCLKCLQKDPQRRYASAEALAQDLERWLAGEPIEARPTGPWERAVKWVKRRPALAAVVLLSGLAALSLSIVSWWYNAQLRTALDAERSEHQRADDNAQEATANAERMREQKERADSQSGKARDNELTARRNLYVAHINFAQRAWEDGQVDHARELLAGQMPERTGGHDFRGFEWHYLYRLCHPDAPTLQIGPSLSAVAFSPDGKYLATVASPNESQIKIWDLTGGRLLRSLSGHASGVGGLAFSRDSTRLATAGKDGTARVWDVATGKQLRMLRGHTAPVSRVAFSPDGTRLATASEDKTMRIWEAATGKEVRVISTPSTEARCVAWSPDGQRLAAGHSIFGSMLNFALTVFSRGKLTSSLLGVWDAQTGRKVFSLQSGPIMNAVAWSPDSRQLASASEDERVRVWDAATGREVLTLTEQSHSTSALAWSPDGKWLASAGEDPVIRVWDARAGTERVALKGSRARLIGLAFSPVSHHLVGAGDNGTVQSWDLDTDPEALTLPLPDAGLPFVAFSPDGQRLATPSGSGVKVWDLATGKVTRALGGNLVTYLSANAVVNLAWSSDGKWLASAGVTGTMSVWDAGGDKAVMSFRGPEGFISSLTFSPDGKYLAAVIDNKRITVWSVATGKQVFAGSGSAMAVGAQGQCFILTASDNSVQVRDMATGKELRTFPGELLDVSPDLKGLGTQDKRRVRIWDVPSGREVFGFETARGQLAGVTLSADCQRLATTGGNKFVNVWDTVSGQELLRLKVPPGHIAEVQFSPDGRRLLASEVLGSPMNLQGGRLVKVWDGTPVQERRPPAAGAPPK